MESRHVCYPSLSHPAAELSAYTRCFEIFIIALKNSEIIRFKPANIAHFEKWLKENHIRDITLEDGQSEVQNTPLLDRSPNKIFKLFKRIK